MFCQEARRSKNKLLQRERDRIRKNEEVNDKIAELDRNKSDMLKAEFEGLSLTGYNKTLRCSERTQQRETQLWNASLTLVRREALRRLLEQERQLHIRELNKKGLAIYQQRA